MSLSAHLTGLELTKTVAVKHIHGVTQTLESLRKRGGGIALDDFGTGYATLSLIRNLSQIKATID
ncbi:EAL domain-containing protein [Sphingomonas sp.]|uniref:EAL domain-containing protein n=1 Tax=Sphingomonas sp. TaxID=28214 RepID=UPI003AFF814F